MNIGETNLKNQTTHRPICLSIRNGNAGINGMSHHLSTSKRDSIKARRDEDPMCVGFISLESKALHWLRN